MKKYANRNIGSAISFQFDAYNRNSNIPDSMVYKMIERNLYRLNTFIFCFILFTLYESKYNSQFYYKYSIPSGTSHFLMGSIFDFDLIDRQMNRSTKNCLAFGYFFSFLFSHERSYFKWFFNFINCFSLFVILYCSRTVDLFPFFKIRFVVRRFAHQIRMVNSPWIQLKCKKQKTND